MNALLRSFSWILIITLCALPFANVQEVRVKDTKGTITEIRNNNNNNNVYTFATDLNTTSYKKMLGVP